MFKEKFDWETKNDGRTLIEAAEIQRDPERLKKAQEYISEQRDNMGKAMGMKPKSTASSHKGRNRATIGKLPTPDGI